MIEAIHEFGRDARRRVCWLIRQTMEVKLDQTNVSSHLLVGGWPIASEEFACVVPFPRARIQRNSIESLERAELYEEGNLDQCGRERDPHRYY